MRRERPDERGHQRHVHHRDLIHDQQIAREWIGLTAFETAFARIGFKQTMDGLALQSGALGQTLGRAPGWRAQRHPHRFGTQDLENRIDQGRLAHPRPAGHDQQLVGQRQRYRRSLTRGKAYPELLLDPSDGSFAVDRGPWRLLLDKRLQPFGDEPFGAPEISEKNTAARVD
jgi:hypothetical protein